MKLVEIILESYTLAAQEFIQIGVPETMVSSYLRNFKRLNTQNKISGPEKDINYWRKQGFNRFKHFVDLKIYTPTKTQLKRKVATGTQAPVIDTEEWSVDVALDATAACNLGRGTKWCTSITDKDFFDRLVKERGMLALIHIRNKHSKDMRKQFAIVYRPPNSPEILDGTDNEIDKDRFERRTGLNFQSIINKVESVLQN